MAWRFDMTGPALFILCFIFTLLGSAAIPLCTDSRAPLPPKTPLSFCSYNGSVCCDAKEDAALKKQFDSLNVSDPTCSSVMKSILCAKCDPFSGELFRLTSQQLLPVPALCNGTVSKDSTQSTDAANNFCSNVWKACQNIHITNSPFAPSLKGGPIANASSSKLTDFWQSEKDFCVAFGGSSSDQQVCFAGSQVTLDSVADSPPEGLCIEKIGTGSYLNMAGHPDGSNRVFLSDQAGKIWLATIPKAGSGEKLQFDESNTPFLDITDSVHFDSEFGLMGIAFHPDFVNNGRFFVSYNCDKSKSAGCSGRCACNSAVDCDPSKLGSDNGALPCQFGSVVAEYSAKTGQKSPSEATTANSLEVRRIFTMGLPYTSHHGGQILFGPADKYLYFMMGDGGSRGDPNNFAQNKKSLLGKIMRLDVDTILSATEISLQGLWGNYSVPKDNPFSEDSELEPEIWALGLRNPWRCSFDSKRPSYFLCADVGQELYEEIDLVTKGGNYGWRVYEGPYLYSLRGSQGNTSASDIQAIPPLMGYNHSSVNKNENSASITGGYYYRSNTDPCMYGRYLYADLYASALWASFENPSGSGKFNSTMIPFNCAADSALPCKYTPKNPLPTVGVIYSFGEDNNKDIYLLTNDGVYRVVPPSRCNYTCSKEVITPSSGNSAPAPTPSSSSANGQFEYVKKAVMLICIFLLAVLTS